MSSFRNTTQYKIAGTDTFRLGSAKVLGVHGSNLQNVEKSLRRIYEPDGYDESLAAKCLAFLESGLKDLSMFKEEELSTLRIMIQCDQSGAEALIVSYLCRKAKFRELFLQGIKPHVFIGLAFPEHWQEKYPQINEIKLLPISEIKTHTRWKELEAAIKESDNNPPSTRYYYHYKQTCHSANYGIKGPTFQLNMLEKSGGKVVLSKAQADKYLQGYRELFPEIPDWNQEVQDAVRKAPHILWNLLGFPRQFTNLKDGDMKDVIAWGPQSTVGVITHVAYTKLQSFIEDNGKSWDLLNNCHDSYLCQCPLTDIKDCATMMQQFMNQDLVSPRGEPFKMKSELQAGFNWSPAKSLPVDFDGDRFDLKIINKYNLLGLREIKI